MKSTDRVQSWAGQNGQPLSQTEHGRRDGANLTATATTPAVGTSDAAGEHNVATPQEEASVFTRFRRTTQKIVLSGWVNVLLVFVPVGIAVHFVNVSPIVIFAMNAIAIIPLAGMLSFATECVAHTLGDTLGALMNVSLGNLVELIIFIIALVKGEIRIVQASLLGSILANLLLILGMCFLFGGLQFREQIYNSTVTQINACLLCLSVLSLLLPTAFHASFSNLDKADRAVLKVSRGTSVILLLVYALYLGFQLKSHAYMYQSTPQHVIDEESHPGILQRINTGTSTSSSSSSSSSNSSKSSKSHRVRRKIGRKLGLRRQSTISSKSESEGEQEETATIVEGESSSSQIPQENERAQSKTGSKSRGKKSKSKKIETATNGPRLGDTASVTEPTPESADMLRPNLKDQRVRPSMSIARSISVRPPPVFRTIIDPIIPADPRDRQQSLSGAPYQLQYSRSLPTLPVTRSFGQQTGSARIAGHAPYAIPAKSPESEKGLHEAPISRTASIILLIVSTVLVAICAEFMVDSIDYMVDSTPLTEAFIGLILIPLIGNAAEHVTAVSVACKNKMDLALGVALGSSIQIALFVTPLVVIIGWCMDKEMSLYFNLFETTSLIASAFIVNFLVLDGRSNYLEGALLCSAYIIIGVGAFFLPNEEEQSALAGGS